MKIYWSLSSTLITFALFLVLVVITFEYYAYKGVVVTKTITTYKVEDGKLIVETKTSTLYKHESFEPGCRSK